MHSNSILAASAVFISAVAAVPFEHAHQHAARDIVWVTETDVDVVTVPVTQTVWINPGETPPTQDALQSHEHHQPKFTSRVQQTVTVPAPSSSSSAEPISAAAYSSEEVSSSSAYVAPTPSTTSVYVAPTSSSTSVYAAPEPSTTSVYIAPTPSSSSVYVAPSPSTTAWAQPSAEAPAVTSAAEAPATYAAQDKLSYAAASASLDWNLQHSSISSGSATPGQSYTGDFTNYNVEAGYTACGEMYPHGNSLPVVAVSHVLFEEYDNGNSNNNPVCRNTITITGKDGNEYKALVVDLCPGCDKGSLDLPLPFFNLVTSNGDGRVSGMSWKWNSA